jgi:hypothetical protein
LIRHGVTPIFLSRDVLQEFFSRCSSDTKAPPPHSVAEPLQAGTTDFSESKCLVGLSHLLVAWRSRQYFMIKQWHPMTFVMAGNDVYPMNVAAT